MAVLYDTETYKELEETPETLAYEHALDISIAVIEAMDVKGMTQKKLSELMGISAARVSQLLNMQANFTLETIAKFELALDIRFFEDIRTKKDGERLRCVNLGNHRMCPVSSDWDISGLNAKKGKKENVFSATFAG